MKNILAIFLLLISFSSFASPQLEKEFQELNCGLTKDGLIDTESDDICHNNSAMRLMSLLAGKYVDISVVLKDTTYMEYHKQKFNGTYNYGQTKERNNQAFQSINSIFYDIAIIMVIMACFISSFVLIVKHFGEEDFKQYSIHNEVMTKLLVFVLMMPTVNGQIFGSFLFTELIAYSTKISEESARKSIHLEYMDKKYGSSNFEVKNYNSESTTINVMLGAYTAIKQTDKAYTQYIKTKPLQLGYDMSDAIFIEDDKVLFKRIVDNQMLYKGGSIVKFNILEDDMDNLKDLGIYELITDNEDELVNIVGKAQIKIADKLKTVNLTQQDLMAVSTLLKASFNKITDKNIKNIWENNIPNLYLKTLEVACYISGAGNDAIPYADKLNGKSNDLEGVSLCVENNGEEYIAVSSGTVLSDINESSKESFDIQKNNIIAVMQGKRAAEEILNKSRNKLAIAYSKIEQTNAEKQFLRYATTNATYMQYISGFTLDKLSFNNDTELNSILKTGLFATLNNTDKNLILDAHAISSEGSFVVIDGLRDTLLKKYFNDILKENNNVKLLGAEVRSDNFQSLIERDEVSKLNSYFLGTFKSILIQYTEDLQTSPNSLSASVSFADKLKNETWKHIVHGVGFMAVKQTAQNAMKSYDAIKPNNAKIAEKAGTSKGFLKTAGKLLFHGAALLNAIIVFVCIPVLIISIFIADILPVMFNLPFILMMLSFNIELIVIALIGIPVFILSRFIFPNDKNNLQDIAKRFITIPVIIIMFPFFVSIIHMLSVSIFNILSKTFISGILNSLTSIGGLTDLFGFATSIVVLMYLLIMTLISSLTICLNVMGLVFDILGVPRMFLNVFEKYISNLNSIFLKIIPMAGMIMSLVNKTEFSPYAKKAKNLIARFAEYIKSKI